MPVDVDPRSSWFAQLIALVDRTSADDGRTRRVEQLLVVLTVLVAVVLGVGGAVLGLVGTGIAGSVATLLLGGGGTVGAQWIARRRAARRAAMAPMQHGAAALIDPATVPFPAPGAGPAHP